MTSRLGRMTLVSRPFRATDYKGLVIMLLPNFTFMLLLIIEGCAGPWDNSQGCTAQNFSLRVPYEKLEQCEAAKRGVIAPEGVEKYVKAICLAVPKPKK